MKYRIKVVEEVRYSREFIIDAETQDEAEEAAIAAAIEEMTEDDFDEVEERYCESCEPVTTQENDS